MIDADDMPDLFYELMYWTIWDMDNGTHGVKDFGLSTIVWC